MVLAYRFRCGVQGSATAAIIRAQSGHYCDWKGGHVWRSVCVCTVFALVCVFADDMHLVGGFRQRLFSLWIRERIPFGVVLVLFVQCRACRGEYGFDGNADLKIFMEFICFKFNCFVFFLSYLIINFVDICSVDNILWQFLIETSLIIDARTTWRVDFSPTIMKWQDIRFYTWQCRLSLSLPINAIGTYTFPHKN